ncbi:carboxylesterase/lipase family protein [Phenylobacterium sp.]|uniref:carboxylesterase/lipase family protein n=1 Tax=Phenylobacterium sp. TaxID=1871053 RepID=UPI0035B3BBCA
MKTWLGGLVAALALAGAAHAQEGPKARIDSGVLAGATAEGVSVFKGVPFAAPPVGALRWAPPAPVAAWSGARDATAFAPICPQPARPDGVLAMGAQAPKSEDCLYLNVWAAPKAKQAPVMVWIHGGAFRFGSGVGPIYDGTRFAQDGVVLVTINYRLGALGFFAHPALTKAAPPGAPLGNYGLMDQLAALKWVQANIAAFGGDPKNVTVFGESAGGSAILSLLSTPAAKGLFAKAIVQSGGGWQARTNLAQAETAGVELMTKAGLGADASLEAMRALPPEALFDLPKGIGSVGPFQDGRLINDTPAEAFTSGRAIDVPLLIGSNSYEASLLKAFPLPTAAVLARLTPAQKAAYADLPTDEDRVDAAYTDLVMGAPARWVAGQAAKGAPSWLYYFSYVPTAQRGRAKGAPHGAEILYAFATGTKLAGRFSSPQDQAMETLVHGCWVAFAKTGAPACPGQPAWPAYNPGADTLMEFGLESGLRPQFQKARRAAAEKASGR